MKCFVCEKNLKSVDGTDLYPYDALHFFTYGHYGSTYFDPVGENKTLNLLICDECLEKKQHLTKEIDHG